MRGPLSIRMDFCDGCSSTKAHELLDKAVKTFDRLTHTQEDGGHHRLTLHMLWGLAMSQHVRAKAPTRRIP